MSREEYFAKYEAMAQKIGIDILKKKILARISASAIKTMSAEDEHLNNIPLIVWDRMANAKEYVAFNGPKIVLDMVPPWTTSGLKFHSLADRICVLKHVAREHIAKEHGDV